MHRFFVETSLAEGEEVELPAAVAHQVSRVLRLRPGATILLLDGGGREFPVELTGLATGRVAGRVGAGAPNRAEPGLAVTLYAAPLKGDHFAYTLQKATEIGAAAFRPLLTERTVAGGEAGAARLARWRRIVREAAEQSGRGRIPPVDPPVAFAAACRAAAAAGPAFIPWEGGRGRGLRAALSAAGPLAALSLLIGPEGGFAPHEIAEARAHGIVPVTLGPRILRAETAAAVALALALAAAGDLA
jgi:16S rRNA (uracil1498-N3)-methyltransferase